MRKLTIAAIALLVLTNVMVLVGVMYNRSEPSQSLDLTERELTVNYSYRQKDENSGTALRINWLEPDSDADLDNIYSRHNSAAWLDEAKLIALGIDVEQLLAPGKIHEYAYDNVEKEVILVLEFNGSAYTQAVAIAERRLQRLSAKTNNYTREELDEKIQWHQKMLHELKTSETRLFVIDAGLDIDVLMLKYSDSNNILLLRGEVSAYRNSTDKLVGQIRELYIPVVHAALPYSDQIVALTTGKTYSEYGAKAIPPRYQVRLNIGMRLEPWIESVVKYGD